MSERTHSDFSRMLGIYLGDGGVLIHVALLAAALGVIVADPQWIYLALIPAGWAAYVLQEHIVHRYVFHMDPPKEQRYFNLLYRLHYGHHDQVHNRDLLFTPVWFSLPLGLLNFAAVSIFLPLEQAFVFTYAGAIAAYLLFEWLHLVSHFNAEDRGRYALYVTRRHARHHFIDHTNWFTVSPGGGMVDRAFGTDPEEVSRREHARTCGMHPEDQRLVTARRHFGEDRTLANRPVGGAAVPAE